jgi:anhydro-N-acetylmuramic acid kinase
VEKELYIGIMTGTSMDGIDTVIADLSAFPIVLHHGTKQFPADLKEILSELASARTVDMDMLARSHFLLAEVYSEAVAGALNDSSINKEDITAIGLHGQTIRHLPDRVRLAKEFPPVGATFQLGSGAALAALAEVDVVSDFRSADVALGGEGAPLMPMFDKAFLQSAKNDRIALNIGGIANITFLPAWEGEIVAFDTGPGNMISDALAALYFDMPFDRDGEIARSGRTDDAFLAELLKNQYFTRKPPKSTGRELFGKEFLDRFLQEIRSERITPKDAIATASELTVRSIAEAIAMTNAKSPFEVIVSGGGVKNIFMMERLRDHISDGVVMSSDEIGIASQSKEALAFAFFAKAFLEGKIIHLPKTTGASSETILGVLSKGRR